MGLACAWHVHAQLADDQMADDEASEIGALLAPDALEGELGGGEGGGGGGGGPSAEAAGEELAEAAAAAPGLEGAAGSLGCVGETPSTSDYFGRGLATPSLEV